MDEKKLKPLVQLNPEVRKRIEEMGPLIEQSEKSIASMKELGLDTKGLEDRLAWAKKARAILLRGI